MRLVETEMEESDRCETKQKTLTWPSSVHGIMLTNCRETRRMSSLPHHKLPPRHHTATILSHFFLTDTSDMMSPFPRWLLIRAPKPSPEDYSTESWTSFHKKYSTKAYRTANMTFKEIEKQKRRELQPSIFARCMSCFHPRSDHCDDCGAARCACANDISPKKSVASPYHHMQKRKMSVRYIEKLTSNLEDHWSPTVSFFM